MRFLNFVIGTVTAIVFLQPEEKISLPIRILVFLIGAGLIFLLEIVSDRKRKKENDAKPLVSVRARVTNRRSIMVGRGRYRHMAYYLTFTTEDGSTMEFEVSELEFSRLGMGEEGTLEYRGWQYLGLRRYDLGKMAPVVASPEATKQAAEAAQPSAGGQKTNGVMTHELEDS